MITVVGGKQGAGKSLWANGYAYKNRKKVNVFSNMPLKDCYLLPKNWYDFKYPMESIILLDESQLEYNCRDYSTKDKQREQKELLRFLTMCRHYKLEIVFITQSIERLDVQIRELATYVMRFKKTLKIGIPILQIGRYFDDAMELKAYMNNTPGWQSLGRPFLKIPYFRVLGKYDTHYIDPEYLEKKEVELSKYD